MLEQVKRWGDRFEEILKPSANGHNGHHGHNGHRNGQDSHLGGLRAATAQLFLAAGSGTALEQLIGDDDGAGTPATYAPRPLAWAPAILGPLTAAAQIAHARRPTPRTATALQVLNGATIAIGAALLAVDLWSNRSHGQHRLAPLALASAGLLGFALDRHEQALSVSTQRLRRRADVVERLVPRRRPKLDRVVVHV